MEYKEKQVSNAADAISLTRCREKQLIFQSADSNGYTREAAIRALAYYPSTETVRALVMRANDWVPAIKFCAKEILSNMLSESSAIHYAKNLDRFCHLRECARSKHSGFVTKIETQLCQYPEALIKTLTLDSAKSARISAGLLAKNNDFSKKSLVNLCVDSPHEGVRLYSVLLMAQMPTLDISSLRKLTLSDKSAKVRCEAFRQLALANQVDAGLVAKELIFDVHPRVRSIAIFQLKKGNVDCATAYLTKLCSERPRSQKIAIWGLMEVFSKSNLNEILCKLDSPYPSVRLQALRACYVLEEEKNLVNLLKKMLIDKSPKIVKEGARMLEKSYAVIPLNELREIILKQQSTKVFGALLRTTHKLNKWKQLIFLSQLSVGANKCLADDIEKTLVSWMGKVDNFFVDPTDKQIAEIRSLNNQAKHLWNVSIKCVIAHRIALCK